MDIQGQGKKPLSPKKIKRIGLGILASGLAILIAGN
jgi:hypothetical protein